MTAAQDLLDAAGLMREQAPGFSAAQAVALVSRSSRTRYARLGQLVAEAAGVGLAGHDAPSWLNEHEPPIALIEEAARLADQCPTCLGTGEVGDHYVCSECYGAGDRRLPPSLQWTKDGQLRTARAAGYTLSVRLVWPSSAEERLVEWSCLTPDGSGIAPEMETLPVHWGETVRQAEERALLYGMLEAEAAVRSEVRDA